MSNTCPICFELFLPPSNQPFILFPCGHTFCKVCINSYAKLKKKCPFCRTPFQSMAPNISLQNLILSANEKKDEVIKRLQAKQEQMLRNNAFTSCAFGESTQKTQQQQASSNFDTDKYINDFRLLDIRCGVLEEERCDTIVSLQEARDLIKSKEKTLDLLVHEKEDCLARLKKI